MSRFREKLDPSPDQIDAALESFWHGSSIEIDRLLLDADGEGPAIGSALAWAIDSQWPSLVESYSIPGYELLREIGRGGMAIVFETIQQSTGRRVALKLVPGFGISRERQARFLRREVQTLSLLRHDGIATLFDAGQTTDKCQYFAMELVAGSPLSQRFAAGPPNDAAELRRRLELVLDVCNAVAYAHRRGVIHCDLKPSNVLVDERGRAKVLDFGLARLLDIDPTSTLSLSGPALMGTLAYMSPEQAAGRATDVDVRSDVYAIGVMMYELLTGERPYELSGVRFPRAIQTICEVQPESPSHRSALLGGDVETIVMTAMAKEPARRYQSVAALATDLQRYLDCRPIEARPASLAYFLTKWCSRHRLSAGLIVALIVLLGAFAVVELRQAYQLAEQRDEARQQARRSEQANAFLRSIFGSMDPNLTGADVSVLSVLDKASARVDHDLRDNPEARAELHDTFGRGYYTLTLYKPADVEFEKAADLWKSIAGDQDARYAASLHMSGMAGCRTVSREIAGARLDRAYAIRKALFAGDHVDIAESLHGLGYHYQYVDFPTAERYFRESLEMRRRLLGDHALVAESLDALGRMMVNANRLAEGEPLLTQALEIRRRLLGPDAREVAVTIGLLGDVHLQSGYFEKAADEYAEQIRIYTRAFGERGGDPLAHALSDLAAALAEAGRIKEAETHHRRAVAMEARVSVNGTAELTQHNFATFLRNLGRYDEAEALARTVYQGWGHPFAGDTHPGVAYASQSLAAILIELGRIDEAEPLLRKGDQVWRELLGDGSAKRAVGLGWLAQMCEVRGQLKEAVSFLQQAAELMQVSPGDSHPQTALVRMQLGRLTCELGDTDVGMPMLRDGYGVIRDSERTGALLKQRGRVLMAEALLEQQDDDGAMALFEDALKADAALELDRHPLRADALLGKAEILAKRGDVRDAAQLLQGANEIYAHRHCMDQRRSRRAGALAARLSDAPRIDERLRD